MAKELRSERRDDLFKEFVIARIEKAGEKFEVIVKPAVGGWFTDSTIVTVALAVATAPRLSLVAAVSSYFPGPNTCCDIGSFDNSMPPDAVSAERARHSKPRP